MQHLLIIILQQAMQENTISIWENMSTDGFNSKFWADMRLLEENWPKQIEWICHLSLRLFK